MIIPLSNLLNWVFLRFFVVRTFVIKPASLLFLILLPWSPAKNQPCQRSTSYSNPTDPQVDCQVEKNLR